MDGISSRFAMEIAQALYFFVPAYLANMAPVFARGHFEWLAAPMDGGYSWRGRRILGGHKTWRGLLSGVVVGAFAFALQCWLHRVGLARDLALLDYGSVDTVLPGALLGLGAGIGDALKSFFKRRVGIAPGASWLGFDQLDFMVGAYAMVSLTFVPPPFATLAILPIVFLGSVASTATGYFFGLKEAWI
jgi:CDP-2,3-bis-(O-geranylgeranyl)-sn-glycerol synthase